MMFIETDKGPSKLEKRLEEVYREQGTGQILITPKQAKDELFKSLLSFYRASVDRPAALVEVLAQIAERKEDAGTFFLIQALEKYKNEQAEQERQVRETLKFAGTLPSRPPVREI